MNHALSSVAASLAIALGLGCAGRAQPPEGAPDMPPDLELMSGYPAGSDPVYTELAEREIAAHDAFERAWKAYSAGGHLEGIRSATPVWPVET